MYLIRLSREWETWPEGVRHAFVAGDYLVPKQMSEIIAGRAIRSGCGARIEVDPRVDQPVKKRAPMNKALGRAPENKLDS